MSIIILLSLKYYSLYTCQIADGSHSYQGPVQQETHNIATVSYLGFPNFRSISFAKISFSQRKCERKRIFSLIFANIFVKFFDPLFKILFFLKNTMFLMRKGKISIFIERKYIEIRENFNEMNEFHSFIFANFAQRKFRWKLVLHIQPACIAKAQPIRIRHLYIDIVFFQSLITNLNMVIS